MLKNHLISIIRSLKKNKGYTLINVSGLAVGFAAAILIAIYVNQELTYDKHHKDYDRIFRLSARSFAFSSMAHLNHLSENMAGVESWVALGGTTTATVKYDNRSWVEKDVYYASGDFFEVFEQDFLVGDGASALEAPNSVVITASIAGKIFGGENPVGKTVELSTLLGDGNYVINGVVNDPPKNSHLSYSILARRPDSYLNNMLNNFNMTTDYCYFKLSQPRNQDLLQSEADEIFLKQMHESWGQDRSFEEFSNDNKNSTPWILNVADVHLESNLRFESSSPGNKEYIKIFIGIAVFIIVLAAINYVNLATAQASKRAKEVGIRKVLGSVKRSMIARFLTESFLMTTVAVIVGLGLAEASLQLMTAAGFSNFNVNVYDYPSLISLILLIGMVTGVLAGIYPAFYLTSFKPAAVLKGDYKVGDKSKLFRGSLVVFQFVVSFSLAIFSIFVYQQLQFGLHKDLGFDKENVIVVDNSKSQLGNDVQNFKNNLLNEPLVSGVSASNYSLINQLAFTAVSGLDGDDSFVRANYKYVDETFVSTMGFRLIDGRDFDPKFEADSAAIIVNEAFAKSLGGDAVGKRLNANFNGTNVVIVGVVEDFHYKNMSEAIGPTIFFNRGENVFAAQINIRLSDQNLAAALSAVKAQWAELSNEPFEYFFFDQGFDKLFEADLRMSKIIGIFTGLSLFVALLGLVGLISYKLDQRVKEIGIRKVLGAGVTQIVNIFSAEMIRLIVIALFITVPIGFYVSNQWLSAFAYHIDITFTPFLTIALGGVAITLIIVVLRTFRTAKMNPVTSLRDQ